MKFSGKVDSTNSTFLRTKKAAELRTPTAYVSASSTPHAILQTKAFLLLPVYHAQKWSGLPVLDCFKLT